MNPTDILAVPVIQYGFAGLCLVLLAIVMWLVRRLLALLEAHGDVMLKVGGVIEANTKAIAGVSKENRDSLMLLRSLNDKLLARPCIARHEEGGG